MWMFGAGSKPDQAVCRIASRIGMAKELAWQFLCHKAGDASSAFFY